MSALRVLQAAGLLSVLLGLVSALRADGSTTTFLVGGLQMLAGLGMLLGGRLEERRREG